MPSMGTSAIEKTGPSSSLLYEYVSTHCMALVPTSNLFYLCVELKNRQQ